MATVQAFGLHWHSPALALPELPGAEGLGPAVISIDAEAPSHWPSLADGPHDTPFVQMAPGELRLTVEGIGRFRVSAGERISWWREHAGGGACPYPC